MQPNEGATQERVNGGRVRRKSQAKRRERFFQPRSILCGKRSEGAQASRTQSTASGDEASNNFRLSNVARVAWRFIAPANTQV